MLSLSVDLCIRRRRRRRVENEAEMTRTRLLPGVRTGSVVTVAMTLVALTTALTELDGKLNDVTVYLVVACLKYVCYFRAVVCSYSRIKLSKNDYQQNC